MKKFNTLGISTTLLFGISMGVASGPTARAAQASNPGKVPVPPKANAVKSASAEETLKGRVIEVKQVTPKDGKDLGVHVLLETERGVVGMSLGPKWSDSFREAPIQRGEELMVIGISLSPQPKGESGQFVVRDLIRTKN